MAKSTTLPRAGLNRREFLKNTALLSGTAVLLPSVLTGCDDDNDPINYTGDFGFRESVASFDPTASSVIVWTRYTPAANESGDASLRWEVADNANFSNIKASGTVTATEATDYTAAADATGLLSNQKYYYRFRSERTGVVSVVGETRTLPAAGQASSVKLAVVSCANYQAGLFNVYGAVAESSADVVIHLGDYIYEYAVGEYGTNANTAALGRAHQPATEILNLADYRTRYRQYRSDKQLQKAHQLKPFICVWDDHEIANDAYMDGAENHQPNEGSFQARKQAAIQVWHEYLPARVTDKNVIYRRFDFGGLVNLLMLDTRLIGRQKQLSLGDYFNAAGQFNAQAFGAAWLNPGRSILGPEQRGWLLGQLGSSPARWQVLGSQVLMAKIYIPVELLLIVSQLATGPTPALLAQYSAAATALATIKARILAGDPTVTAAEKARVDTVLPYNLDSWDGYPAEREVVLAAATRNNLISLAGDTHNAWESNLTTSTGKKVGTELAVSSVSSPGFESLFAGNTAAIKGFEQSNQLLINDVNYVDASQRGFMEVEFTASAATSRWQYVSTLFTETTATTTGHTATVS